MSKDTEEWADRMRELYAKYLEHCAETGITPATPTEFERGVQEQMAKITAEMAIDKDIKKYNGMAEAPDTLYVCKRVKDLLNPVAGAAIRICSQCGESVWVQLELLAKVKNMVDNIICTECLPEITGRNINEIVKEKLDDL